MTNITVTNRKGGVGKTTMAVHIAAGLATVGYRVLLLDADPQGNSAWSFGIEPIDALYATLADGQPTDQHILPVPATAYSTADNAARGQLFLLPGADMTAAIPSKLGQFGTFKLLDMLDAIKPQLALDFAVIDTSPTLKEFDASIYLATDAFIYVTEAESLARRGLDHAVKQMVTVAQDRAKHLGRRTGVLGVLPNKVRPTVVHQMNLDKLDEGYGRYVWQPLPLRIVWAEASQTNQTVYTYAPTSEAANDAWRMVENTVKAVHEWQTSETN